MERRKRVEMIMNSRIFREELERIIEVQMRDGGGGPAGLVQQISDIIGQTQSGRSGSNLYRSKYFSKTFLYIFFFFVLNITTVFIPTLKELYHHAYKKIIFKRYLTIFQRRPSLFICVFSCIQIIKAEFRICLVNIVLKYMTFFLSVLPKILSFLK
jgi:hypothetical protein